MPQLWPRSLFRTPASIEPSLVVFKVKSRTVSENCNSGVAAIERKSNEKNWSEISILNCTHAPTHTHPYNQTCGHMHTRTSTHLHKHTLVRTLTHTFVSSSSNTHADTPLLSSSHTAAFLPYIFPLKVRPFQDTVNTFS